MKDITYYLAESVSNNCRRIRVLRDYNEARGYMRASIKLINALFVSNQISYDMYQYYKRKLHESFIDGGFASKWNVKEYGMRVSKSRRKIFKRRVR